MSLSCEWCGHKTSEVKSGSSINDKGSRITLKITDISDLSQDILEGILVIMRNVKVVPGNM